MKFFRMDSDLPDWEVWDDIRKQVGMDFHVCMALYIILYAKLSANYVDPEQKFIEISEASLRNSWL